MVTDRELLAKVEADEGLTAEEIVRYRQLVKPQKHVYGKYGTLRKRYLEELGIDWTIADLPTYLHGVDRAAGALNDAMMAKLEKDERYKRTGDFMEDYRRLTEVQRIIDEEILHEIVFSAEVYHA